MSNIGSEVLGEDEAHELRKRMRQLGSAASKAFGMSQRTLTKAACGLPVTRLTVTVIRAVLARPHERD